MPERPRPPAAREHDLVGAMNPRCLRCHRTLMDIIRYPATPCRRTVVKAELRQLDLFTDVEDLRARA